MNERKKLLSEYVEKYLRISQEKGIRFNKTNVATVLYNNFPDIFKSVEYARASIRWYLGKQGLKSRIKNQELVIPEPPYQPIKRLFIDIETAPMRGTFWRIGSKVSLNYGNVDEDSFVLCVSYKWQNEDSVHTLRVGSDLSDKELLEKLLPILSVADEVVGHNINHFDIKVIRTRCAYHGLKAMPKYRTFDTLSKARRYFSFPDNKLDTIAKFLGVGQKLKHRGYAMWKDVLNGVDGALDEMVRYCEIDIVTLEDVFMALQHYMKPNVHVGVLSGESKYTCPICANKKIEVVKNDVTQKGTISRVVKCVSCEHIYNISNKSYMDYLKDKMGGVV